MTRREYLADHELTGTAVVQAAGVDDGGDYVVLDRTLFHPQGGGQKSDRGTIDHERTEKISSRDGEVRHYISAANGFAVGQSVKLSVDAAWRKEQAQHHSAGHLLAAVTSNLFPSLVGKAGHHWPGESRLEFEGEPPMDFDAMNKAIEDALDAARLQALPIKVVGDPFSSRAIQIGDFLPAVPCGGTHVSSTAEIGRVVLRGIKHKSGKLRISYAVFTDESKGDQS